MLQVQMVPLDDLLESPLNPRKHVNQAKLEELAASMGNGVGIIAPLVVRAAIPASFSTSTSTAFEVIDGVRRLRAARLAGVSEAPIIVRDLTDVQVLEVMMIANGQREDVHPLEEAEGYAALLRADQTYTIEAIALKVGKSVSYVYQRLKLQLLIDEAKEAFYAGQVTIAHATRLARLPDDLQTAALDECFVRDLFHARAEDGDYQREPAPVSQLDRWMATHVREQVKAADTQHYFPEIVEEVEQIQATDPDAKLLELSESHHVSKDLGTKKHGALGAGRWTAIRTKADRCAHIQRGVVVHGGPMRVLEVCATKGCPKHFPVREASTGDRTTFNKQAQKQRAAQEAQSRKTEEERKAWELLQPKALNAFATHVAKLPVTPALLKLLFGDYEFARITNLTGPITAKNMGQAFAVSTVIGNAWNRQVFLQAVKPFKFNLGVVELAEKKVFAAKAPKKPAAKKPLAKPRKKGRRA